MFFNSPTTREICQLTGGLKLGRLQVSYFGYASREDDAAFVETINELKKISGIEVLTVSGGIPCFSFRLSQSIMADEKKVQEVANAIQQNLIIDEDAASSLIDSMKKFTGFQLKNQAETPSNDNQTETKPNYQSYINQLQEAINLDKETLALFPENKIAEVLERRNAIKEGIAAHEARIATLRKMEKNELITQDEHENLLLMKPLANTVSIASYAHVIQEETCKSKLTC